MNNTMSTTGSAGLRFGGESMGMEIDKYISDQEILAAYAGLPASDAREQFKKDYDIIWKFVIEKRKKIQEERERKNNPNSVTTTTPVEVKVQQSETFYLKTFNKETQKNIMLLLISNNIDIVKIDEHEIVALVNNEKIRILPS